MADEAQHAAFPPLTNSSHPFQSGKEQVPSEYHNRRDMLGMNDKESSNLDASSISQAQHLMHLPGPGAQGQKSSSPCLDDKSAIKDLEAAHETTTQPAAYSVFSHRTKQYIVFMTSWAGFFSPLSANIYFPVLGVLARELRVSDQQMNLTVTTYMIFQGIAPTFYGDLADMAGRRPAYIIGFIIYLGANLGLALQNNYAALLVLRCMQSSGSSGMIALGNGIVADIAPVSERGVYMGFAMAGPMIGPAVGPILGGLLAHYLGWPAIFWFLFIFSGAYFILYAITHPETARKIVGNGSVPPRRWNRSLLDYVRLRQSCETGEAMAQDIPKLIPPKLRFPNPLHTITMIFEKDVGILLFYNAIVYTAWYDVTSSLPFLFEEIYGFSELQIGLAFIPFGVGCTVASIATGHLMDWNFARIARDCDYDNVAKTALPDGLKDFPLEKARVQVVWPLLYTGIAATLCYGWVLEKSAPLAAPLVLQFVIGLCFTGVFDIMSTLFVDLYPQSPATATAANNLVRCLLGAAGTALIIQMIKAMGKGWCFTFLAAVVFVLSPLLAVDVVWGPKWREARRLRLQASIDSLSASAPANAPASTSPRRAKDR